jgi:arabinofuranan 3-O-arabinosyltransferase
MSAVSAPPKPGAFGQTIARLEDRVFTESRLLFCGAGIAIGYAVLLARIMAYKFVIGPGGHPSCAIDFCTIWVSGKFAAASVPARVYDYSLFAAAQHALVGPNAAGFPAYHYAYPPVFLFFTYPLGLMPYFVAFAIWIVVTLALYEAAVHAIIPRFSAVVAALTPFAVVANIAIGQNGLLTAGLIGLALASVERRAWLCGALLGLLTYKPEFGIAFPLALLASRNWRAFASATAASVGLAAAAAIAFGYRTWPSFLATLDNRNSSLGIDRGVVLTQQSVYGLVHWAAGGMTVPLLLHIVVAAAVALAIGIIWAKPLPYSLKAAALCLASVTITPYVEIYDLCILSIAVAFLIEDGLARGFLPGERATILLCFGGLFFFHIPIGPVICAMLFCLVGRRIRAWRRDRFAAPVPVSRLAGEDAR